ncbi:uncharacterized protein LOC117124526 [Anneissia japonica]|uniref:uncharacterized protein LOC117124526 n=1 Tax=Anneissia japonica TaxID=1529436 RepID=UPI001425798F|nr:uncharacterized protein LOC117124526 [Anneissia japonica]XP_033126670.1 uncharacterized protein LOC117124526 [Anneissia japonica]
MFSHAQQARGSNNYSGSFSLGPEQSGIGHNYGPDGHYGPMANMYDGYQSNPNATPMKQFGSSIGNETNFLGNADSSGVTNMNNQAMFNAGDGTSGYAMQQQNFPSYPSSGYGIVGQDSASSQNRSFPMNSTGINNFDQSKPVAYNSGGIPGKTVGYPMGPGTIGSRRVSAPPGIGQRNFQQRSTSFTQEMAFTGSDMNSGFTSDQHTMNSVTNRNYPSGQYHVMQVNQSNMYVPGELPMVSEGNLQQNYQQPKYSTSYPNSTSMGMQGQKLNYGMPRPAVYSSGSSALTRTTSRPSIQRSFSTGRVEDSYNKMATGGHLMSASFELNRGFMNGTEFGNMQMKGEPANRIPNVNMSSNLLDSMGQHVGNQGSIEQAQVNRVSSQRLRHYGPSPSNHGMAFSNVQGMDSTPGFPNASFNPMQSTSGPLNSNPTNFESGMPNAMQSMSPPGSGPMNMDNMPMVNQPGYMNTPSVYPDSDNFNIPRSQRYPSKLQPDAYGSGLPSMNGGDMMGAYDPNIQPMAMSKMNASNPMQFQPQISRRHTRTDRIFSQELEKLAKLSRNPMSEPFTASPITTPIDSAMNPQVNSFPVTPETISSPNNFPKTSISPGFQPEQLPQPSQLPDNEAFVQNTQINCKNTNLKPIQNLPNTPHYSAPSTPNNQTAMDIPVSAASSTNNTTTSHTFSMTDSGKSPSNEFIDSKVEIEDKKNAVHQLKRITHSLKDKQTEKGQQSEYISHGTEGNTEGGSQNCIAALSAACRNMIADMDSTMPKQKAPNQGQGNSSLPSFETLTSSSTPNYSSNAIGRPPNNCGMANSTTTMPPNSFSNNQYNMNSDYLSSPPFGGTNHYMGTDFQLQYQDFLEQSLPMQMTHKRPDEKPKRTRRRKVSEDMSDQISNSSGQKRRRSRKKSQNPPSVDSIGTPQSIDTCATPAMSDHFLDDITNNGACNTPIQSMSFGSLNSHTPSPNCPNSKPSPGHDDLSGNFLDSDNFESVFSPDTTAQNLTQDPDDVTNSGLLINPSPNASKPTTPNRPSSNYSSASLPIVSPKSGPLLNCQPSNLPTSTSMEFIPSQVSSASEKVTQSQEATNEAHPLEILQQQIQLQRQQFNLGETGSLIGNDSTVVKTEKNSCNNSNHSQTDINVDALITDKNSSWYLTNDSKKDEVLLPWEDSKKAASTMPSKGRSLQSLMCIS